MTAERVADAAVTLRCYGDEDEDGGDDEDGAEEALADAQSWLPRPRTVGKWESVIVVIVVVVVIAFTVIIIVVVVVVVVVIVFTFRDGNGGKSKCLKVTVGK